MIHFLRNKVAYIFKQLSAELCCNQYGPHKKREPKQYDFMSVSVPFCNFFFYLFMVSSSNGRHEDCTSFSENASVPLGCLVTPAATERRRRRTAAQTADDPGPRHLLSAPLKRLCTPGSGGPEAAARGGAEMRWGSDMELLPLRLFSSRRFSVCPGTRLGKMAKVSSSLRLIHLCYIIRARSYCFLNSVLQHNCECKFYTTV